MSVIIILFIKVNLLTIKAHLLMRLGEQLNALIDMRMGFYRHYILFLEFLMKTRWIQIILLLIIILLYGIKVFG